MPEVTSSNKENYPNLIDERKYGIWISKLYNKFSLPYPIVSLFFGLSLFILGYIISYFYNFSSSYISTLIIYLATAGIIWVSSCMVWGAKNYVKILNKVRPYFNVSDNEYLEITDKWLKLIHNDKLMLGLAFLAIVFGYFLVYSVYHHKITYLMIFPSEWYIQPTFYKILIIDIYLTFVVLLLITSGVALIFNVLLMNNLGKKPVFFYPNLTKKLKPLCDFNLILAITWLIGSALILRAIYNTFNVITVLFQLIIVAIGISTFFVPQISLHRTLKKTKEEVLHSIDQIYEEHFKIICRTPGCLMEQTDFFMKFYALDKMRAIVESQSKTWIYDMSSMLKLSGSSLLVLSQPIINKIIQFISSPH